MTNTGKLLSAGLLLALSTWACADDLTDAARGLCDNIKTCALEKIAEENLTDEMRAMMGPMMDNMCAAMQDKVQEVPEGHALYEPALLCMRSMESLTCAQMQDEDQVMTSECKEYERLAKEAEAAKK
jgi:hypothetical protein